MVNQHSPDAVFRERLHQLNGQLPGVRDGSDEAIHIARVATRRLREALPLLGIAGPEVARARRWLRRTGRGLGRVRDVDIMRELALATVNRLPAAAVPLQHLLVELRRARDASLRRAVKRLERNEGNRLLAPLAPLRAGAWRRAAVLATGASWTGLLATRILKRADALRAAVHRAGGINFPNRVHAVRIAAKKLRYAIEVAERTRLAIVPQAIFRLKRVQDLLGELHDRQVFLRTVDERAADAGPEHILAFDAVRAHVESEARDLHGRYLRERAALLELCDAATAACRPPRRGGLAAGRPVLIAAAGALIVPPAVRLLRRAG